MAVPKYYSNSVWKAIKDLWEVSPTNVSLRAILEQVAQSTGENLPSLQAVNAKIKREKWKKFSKKVLKKGVEKGVENQQNFNSEKTSNNEFKTDTYVDNFNSDKNQNNVDENEQKITSEKLPPSIEVLVKGEMTKAQILINKLRNQSLLIFNVNSNSIELVSSLIEELDSFDENTDEATLQTFFRRMQSADVIAKVVKALSDSSDKNIKTLVGLYGLADDAFVDREEKRVRDTQAMAAMDKKLEIAKKQMALEQKKVFKRDLTAIEDKMRN